MTRESQKGESPVAKLEGEFSNGLGAVAEIGDLVGLGDFGDRLHGIDGADFVVGGHDARIDGGGSVVVEVDGKHG